MILVEWAVCDDRRFPLSAHRYGDGTVDPHGYRHLEAFHLDGMLPVWTFALADALLERWVWMEYGANTTYVMYRVVRASRPIGLEITPLVTYRDFHTLASGRGWQMAVEAHPRGAVICAFEGARPFRLEASTGAFVPGGDWYWNFLHEEETARGLDDRADLFAPGTFSATLRPQDTLTLVLSAETAPETHGALALERARARQRDLLARADAESANAVLQHLVLAAHQFIVARHSGGRLSSRTVIAGYHWFNDWGRDTMIALPGLTLTTGRAEEASAILRAFAPYVQDGLLPNNFPDRAGITPGHNTADASLWYVLAVRAHQQATSDGRLADDLLPVLRDIVDRYALGTRFGIGADPDDGLLRAGEPVSR